MLLLPPLLRLRPLLLLPLLLLLLLPLLLLWLLLLLNTDEYTASYYISIAVSTY